MITIIHQWPQADTRSAEVDDLKFSLFTFSSDEEVTITGMLNKVLRRSDAVDKESLCILAGQRMREICSTAHALLESSLLNTLDDLRSKS
ncbi:hypothetical protein JOM56_005077 [Amanita muscaria]